MVAPTLEIPGLPDHFALGDMARFEGPDGQPLPGLAQVAKQQGIHLGRELARHIQYGTHLRPFQYRSRGNTAIVGRHAAIYETPRLRLKGWFAWALWAIVHVYLLVGFQHRLTVSLQWLWRYLTYERGARLISTNEDRAPPVAADKLAGSSASAVEQSAIVPPHSERNRAPRCFPGGER